MEKGREDLAREALVARRRYGQRVQELEDELDASAAVVEQYHQDIAQLEQKLAVVREKQRMLIQRHKLAAKQKRARSDIRRADSAEVMMRFEQFENRVERMEAEAQLVNAGRDRGLETEFDRLVGDDEIEDQLRALKEQKARAAQDGQAQ